MIQTLTLQQAAERLHVRPKTIHEFVAKKRLRFVGNELLDADEVEKLALFGRLRRWSDVLGARDQEASGTRARVIDALAQLWIDDPDHRFDDWA